MARRNERGAIAVWAAVAMFAFIVAIGIGVDFSGHARAEQELRTVAREAARTGAQESRIVIDDAKLDPTRATSAAQRYFHAAGYQGSATVIGGTTVEVKLHADYPCMFLSIIGIHTLPTHATARAQITPAYQGQPG
ncbi:MAG: pilus assembly protein TadG-related protein [Propionibacteriaceae bacterium]|nr:pilus assembly protein TadG-related protein [Propionibacteriaceae bacterium]